MTQTACFIVLGQARRQSKAWATAICYEHETLERKKALFMHGLHCVLSSFA